MNYYEISNEFLQVTLSDFGGEMTSVKFLGKERLWNGNPEFWGRHAPFLFPIVGSLRNGTAFIKGEKYSMAQHGLCRIFTHEVVEKSENSITFCFSSSSETLEKYPYQFDFFTKYTLVGKKIETIITIKNKGEDELVCSVGAHPAFLINLYQGDTLDNYQVVFEKREKTLKQYFNIAGLYSSDTTASDVFVVDISEESLNNTIIFSGFESSLVSLVRKGTGEKVSACLDGHSVVAFWKAPNSPFLCLEPWNGIADRTDTDGNFENKPFIERIQTQKEYDFSLIFE